MKPEWLARIRSEHPEWGMGLEALTARVTELERRLAAIEAIPVRPVCRACGEDIMRSDSFTVCRGAIFHFACWEKTAEAQAGRS